MYIYIYIYIVSDICVTYVHVLAQCTFYIYPFPPGDPSTGSDGPKDCWQILIVRALGLTSKAIPRTWELNPRAQRLIPIIADNLIPSHQFGFRPKHGTIEQVHRVVHKINDNLENKRFCSAAFIDISQAFDKVWHTGL